MGAPSASVTARELMARPVDVPAGLAFDPFRSDEALHEAEVVEACVWTVDRRTAIAFDLRVALNPQPGNAGILIADRVSGFGWAPDSSTPIGHYAWVVVASRLETDGPTMTLIIGTLSGELRLTFEAARFYVAAAPTLQIAPSDYTSDPPNVIEANTLTFDTPLRILAGSSWPG